MSFFAIFPINGISTSHKENLAKIDKKLLNYLNNTYNVLHIDGYYEGVTEIKVIEAVFENAELIINALKQYSKNEINN